MRVTDVGATDLFALGTVKYALNDQGLILLQGENKEDSSADSNGAGKSSLIETVSWVAYGTTAKGLSGDDVIREGAKVAIGTVDLEDEDADEKWRINRSRKKNRETLQLYQWNETTELWEDRTLGTTKLTQALIEKIIGCSHDVFSAAVYIGQEKLVDLPALGDKALKELIEEAAGVKILERAYEGARERLSKVEADLENLQTAQRIQQAQRATLVNNLATENTHHKRWATEQEATVAFFENQTSEFTEEALKVADEIVKMRPRITVEAEIVVLDTQLGSFAGERATERKLAGEVQKAERARDLKAGVLRRAVEDAQRFKAESVSVASQIGKPCPECGTAMTEEHVHHAKDAAETRARAALATVATERTAWEALKAAAEAAQAALEAYRATMRDPSTVATERDAAFNELGEITKREDELKRLRKSIQQAKDNADKRGKEINPHAAVIDKLTDDIVKGDKELLDRGEEITKLEEHKHHHALVVEVFSPKGVRAHILDEVTPFLNDRTSHYLGTLSDGNIQATWSTLQTNAKGELKERFAIDVVNAHGGKSFAAQSGGERRKVRLACALALQDLVASRATKPFRLWVGDEIDQALDPAGLERLMTVLQEKAKERGTVVVISHSNLRDWINNVWTVVKEGGKSELVM